MKKILKFIIIFLILILLAISVLAYIYIETDFLKTPDQLFKKYLLNGVIQISSFNVKPYDEIIERAKEEKLEIASESEKEYTPQTDISNFIDEEQEVEKKKIFVKESVKIDVANKNMAYIIDAKCEDKDFLKVNILKTDDLYGVHIPELHEKYLVLENKELRKIPKTFGAESEIIDFLPNELPKFSFSENQSVKAKELMIKYTKKISDSIDVSLYTKEDYEFSFDNESFQGSKYVLTIQEEKLEEIMSNIYDDLGKDQDFWELIKGTIFEYYANYIKAMNDFSNSLAESLANSFGNIEDINGEEGLEENVEVISKEVKIAVYEYEGKTIKIEMIDADGGSNEITINNKENLSRIFMKSVQPRTEFIKVGEENIIDLSNKYENNKGEFVLLMQGKYNQEDIENEKTEKQSENSYFSDWYDDEYFASKYPETELNIKVTTNYNQDVINTNLKYNIKGEEVRNEEFDIITKFNPNIKVPLLKDENMLVLNNYTKEEFMELGNDLNDNLYQSAEDAPESLIGSIYKQKIEEELENIEYYREYVYEEVKETIEAKLDDYKWDLEMYGEANIDDYLNIDEIQDDVGIFIDEIELIDGNTIKCIADEYTYFVKINIDGNEWLLTDIQVLYSEDGSIEKAE